jgi:hypothetical protein
VGFYGVDTVIVDRRVVYHCKDNQVVFAHDIRVLRDINFAHFCSRSAASEFMSNLKFKFNKPKATPPPPVKVSKPAAFGDSDDDEDSVLTKRAKQPAAIAGLNEDLRTYNSLSEETSARIAKEVLETDPSGIFLL